MNEGRAEEQSRCEAMLELAPDAVIAFDATGRVTEWNLRAASLFGWSKGEVLGHDLQSLILPEAYWETHQSLLKTGPSLTADPCEVRGTERPHRSQSSSSPNVVKVQGRTGPPFDVEWHVHKLPTAGDEPEYCVFVRQRWEGIASQDRQQQDALDLARRAEEAEEQLSLALSSSEAGTWNWDMRTGLIRWDDYIHPLFGLPLGAFLATTMRSKRWFTLTTVPL